MIPVSVLGHVRWIAEAPAGVRMFDHGRAWRWSPHDVDTLQVWDLANVRTARDPRRDARGLDQPGLCVFDAGQRPILALARFPCLRDDLGIHEDSVLAPDGTGGFRRIGLATSTRDAQTLRDGRGAVMATRTWPQPFRAVPVDENERVHVHGREWQVREVMRRTSGFFGWLWAPELVGVELHDGHGAWFGARHEGELRWEGDVTVPLVLEGNHTPDPWTLAAFMLLVLCVFDACDLGRD